MRINIFLRGALLLPVFFYTLILTAEDFFQCSFYQKPNSFVSFLKTNRHSRKKDLLINRYHLPLSGRVYKYDFPVKKVESFTDGKENYYIYLKCRSKCSYSILFSGIAKGTVSINGSKRGNIDLKSVSDYSLLTLNLSKGIYFFSLVVKEKYQNFPITILSDKRVKISAKRGFNRDAKAFAVLKNINISKNNSIFEDELYKSFCFPFCSFSKDSLNAEINSIDFSEYSGAFDATPIIVLLSRVAYDKDVFNYLKKLGFTNSDLDWWKIKSKKGFCR